MSIAKEADVGKACRSTTYVVKWEIPNMLRIAGGWIIITTGRIVAWII